MFFGEPPVWVHGDPDLATRVVAALRRARRRVRWVTAGQLAQLRPGRCRTLVLAEPPEMEALLLRLSQRLARHPRGPALRLVLMHHADRPPALAGALANSDPEGPLRVEPYVIEDRAARSLLARWPPHFGMDPPFGQGPHLLVAGLAAPARSYLLQALRVMYYDERRPRVTLLCEDATDRARAFARAFPQARESAEILWQGLDSQAYREGPPVTQVLVCAASPRQGLELALDLASGIAGAQRVSPPILVERGDQCPAGKIDDWDGQIFPFSYLEEACRPEILLHGKGDQLAQAIHEHYTDTIAAQGRDPTLEPAGREWDRLAPSYQDANRYQADHLGAKLAVTDCRAVPEEQVESFAFTPLEAERLAVIEHLRWCADRYLDGWTYGPERDNALKRHPQLIPYPNLSRAMKDLDRFAARGVPALLARSGLGVKRMLILGVQPPSGADPKGTPRRPLIDRVLRRLLARYPDRSLVVASTLSDPWSRLAVRLALDLGAGLFLLCPGPLPETLAAQPDAQARRDLLGLVARAERRIALPEPAGLEHWLSRRAEILLSLEVGSAPLGVAKRVVIDAANRRAEWGFEY